MILILNQERSNSSKVHFVVMMTKMILCREKKESWRLVCIFEGEGLGS